MLIEEESNRKLARKSLSSKDFKVELSKSKYQNILSNFETNQQQVMALRNLLRDDEQQKKKNEQKSKLIDNTLHELRKLNTQIKKQSEILKNAKGITNSKLDDLSKNIFSTSQLISTRLDAYDFTINPNLIDMYGRRPVAVYKKFEKAYHCLKRTVFERNLQINLKKQSTTEILAYRIFELLPFMLLENAIKYSPENREINCYFHEQNKKLKSIIIDSYGPKLEPGEIHIITDKGVRGKNAHNVEGSGIGLYLARLICEYHSIELNISQFGTEKTIDGIIYLGFKVSLIFE